MSSQTVRSKRPSRPLAVASGSGRKSVFLVGGKLIWLCFLIPSEQTVAAKDDFTTHVWTSPVPFFVFHKNKQWSGEMDHCICYCI